MKNILSAIKSVLRGFDNKLNQIENHIEKSISDAVKTMTGASDTEDGKSGIVPAPKAGQQNLPLCGDGQYKMLPQADYTQNDATASNYIKNRPGGYIGEQKTYKLDISAVKQDGIDKLTDVSVIQDDFMHMSSINVEISHSSGTINRTLTQREIGPYIINEYGAQIYGNAHLINPSQPDTGEDMALYKQMDSQSSYSIGWHVWATSVPSGDVEVCVVEKTMNAVRFDPEFIPWYGSPTKDAVLYTAQSLTEEQQTQARANIGAGTPYTLPEASPDALGGVKADAAETADTQPVRKGTDGKLYTAPGVQEIFTVNISKDSDGNITADKTFAEIKEAHDAGMMIFAVYESKIYSPAGYAPDGIASFERNSGSSYMGFTCESSGGGDYWNYFEESLNSLGIFGATAGQIPVISDVDEYGYPTSWASANMPSGGGADISLGISGATAGQMAKVKAVDGNGAPTAWEAGDAAGGEEWELINEISTTQWVSSVTINQDSNGNPFSLKKMKIFMTLPKTTNEAGEEQSNPGYALYRVNDRNTPYQNPASGWESALFVWEIEAWGDYCTVTCFKDGRFSSSLHHSDIMVDTGKFGAISKFTWRLFNGSYGWSSTNFKVYGVRA